MLENKNLEKLNLRMAQRVLGPVIGNGAVAAIERELELHCRALFELGKGHRSAARKCSVRQWRQAISRYYYASYSVSKAVRLHNDGIYSRDVSDHRKFEDLPPTFPNRATYVNRLPVLRDDRNLSDYDHSARIRDLVISRADAAQLIDKFFEDSRTFFSSRGFII